MSSNFVLKDKKVLNVKVNNKQVTRAIFETKNKTGVSRNEFLQFIRKKIEGWRDTGKGNFSIGMSVKHEKLHWRGTKMFKIEDIDEISDIQLLYDADGSTSLIEQNEKAGNITGVSLTLYAN